MAGDFFAGSWMQSHAFRRSCINDMCSFAKLAVRTGLPRAEERGRRRRAYLRIGRARERALQRHVQARGVGFTAGLAGVL